jgi:peptidase M28-like protein
MAPVIGGPLMSAAGAVTGSRMLQRLGVLFGLGAAATMAEIGSRGVVPGANDNGTAVILLLAIAASLAEEPTENLRVMLVSTGSEESFSEGIKAFGERHFRELPRESTFFLCVETLGSPHLLVLRGEGFLKMHEYTPRALAFMDELAEDLGIWLFPNLRLHNGTDGLEALAAGYPTAVLASVNKWKNPSYYHWPNDVPENVDYGTLADAVRLTSAAIRRLDEDWPF